MKRRKSKDNPYNINYLESKQIYEIEFIDSNKIKQKMETSKEIYELFNQFELEDISHMNKYDRHIEHIKMDEIQIYKRAFNKEISVEEKVIQNIKKQSLYDAIEKLPELQKQRIYLYYFYNMTQREIAYKQKCSIRAIQYSLQIALKKLRKLLE